MGSASGMEYLSNVWNGETPASKPLNIIIVGAGVAGLSCAIGLGRAGHHVTVLEATQQIKEVGAGIQMAPNNTRILYRWGLLPEVMKYMSVLEKNSLRRWKTDEELGTAPLMPGVAEKYHAPLGTIHRGDLQRILLDAAIKSGANVRLSCAVSRVDGNFEARVQLSHGEWVEGDLVIAADGIKSGIRKQIAASHNHIDQAAPTGDAAYRITIPKSKLEHDPRALELLQSNVGMRWMGPRGHIMAYPIKNNTLYNMVLVHPEPPNASNDESWNRKGDKAEMMEFYKDWNDTVKNLLSYVPEGEVMEWTLNSHRQLPAWHENKIVVVGDASHPMLPYVSQGAAQAMEDAAVLTVALSKTSDIPVALLVYEEVRKARGEAIQRSATQTQRALHLVDGPDQERRDQAIRNASKGQGRNPDMWADEKWQQFMWGTDVMKETFYDWDELAGKALGFHLHALTPTISA